MPRNWERLACNAFASLNFGYGLISWFAAASWGRHVLFRAELTQHDFVRPIEYYAVAIGLVSFHAAALTLIMRECQVEKIKMLHAWAQLAYWTISAGIGVYFGATEVYRPEIGFAHAFVALGMAVLALQARRGIIAGRRLPEHNKKVADNTHSAFTIDSEEQDDLLARTPRTAKKTAKA